MCAQSFSRLKMTSRRVMRQSSSITRRHPQFRPIRSFKSLVRSCLFNVAFLSTQWQKLIQYLFRVRASQNYHHLLWSCATCTGGHPDDPKKRQQQKRKLFILFHHIKRPGEVVVCAKGDGASNFLSERKSPSFVWCPQTGKRLTMEKLN